MEKLLFRSIETREKLELSKTNQISQRMIRVIQLRQDCILAYCYTKRSFRLFNLENILAVDLPRGRRGAS